MSKTKRIEGPFQSEFGTFTPGDPAIAITVCTGRVCVDRVEYVGYVERSEYNYKTKQYEPKKFAQIRRPTSHGEWFDKATGETCNWTSSKDLEWRSVPATTISTLQYNRLLPASASTDDLIKVI